MQYKDEKSQIIMENIAIILKDEDFNKIFDEFFETKSHHDMTLKEMCAGFFIHGIIANNELSISDQDDYDSSSRSSCGP